MKKPQFFDPNIRRKAMDVFAAMDTENLIAALEITPNGQRPQYEFEELERAMKLDAEKEAQTGDEFPFSGDFFNHAGNGMSRPGGKRGSGVQNYTAGFAPRPEPEAPNSGGFLRSPAPGVKVTKSRQVFAPAFALKAERKRPEWDTDDDAPNNGIDTQNHEDGGGDF